MIARTAVDAQALAALAKLPQRQVRNVHQDLCDTLLEGAELILTSEDDRLELLAAIRAQPSEIIKEWTEVLKALSRSRRVGIVNPPKPSTSQLLHEGRPLDLADHADVVIVTDELADARGFSSAGYGKAGDEPELAVVDSISRCDTMRRMRALRELGNFPEGTPRDDIWALVFGPLAKRSSNVTLLDRYLLKDALEGSRWSRDHAKWLLRRLDGSMRQRAVVRILSELPKEWAPDVAERLARERLETVVDFARSIHLDSVEVTLAPLWRPGAPGPHNRHIRFDGWIAIEATEGFDRLGTPRVSGVDGFTWRAVRNAETLAAMQRREQVVSESKGAVRFRIP